jgi:hypothetical protein
MSNDNSEWPDDDALDAAQAERASNGDTGEAIWLLRRMFSHIITGSPASEPLRRYADECDAALARATNERERLQALNLAATNPSHRPESSGDEKLREQAATAAATILLLRSGQSKREALTQLGAMSGREPRTLQRYLSAFGKEAYAALESRDSTELRALADRCYAVALATILTRKRQ